MGKLTARKSKLVFETSDEVRERGKYRQVVIEAQPTHAVLRLKGMRGKTLISWGGIYNYAIKCRVAQERAAKLKERKERKTR